MRNKLNATKKRLNGQKLAMVAKATHITIALLLISTILSTFILSRAPTTISANAESIDVITSITVTSSCTMVGTIESNKAHTATVQSGSYTADIGETLISVNCNDNNGYSVYAIGFTSDVDGTTTLLGTNTNLTIPTGTSTSTASSNWAMKLTPVSGNNAPTILSDSDGSFASYHIIPATATKVATFTNGTESSSEFKTTYAVAIGTSQPADTYVGQVKYTLVHPATNIPNAPQTTNAGNIGYFPNAGNEVPDTMGDQEIDDWDTSAMLWASNFKRTGYGFAGWSDAFDYVIGVGSESNPNAHIYGPNETIEFTAGQYSSPNEGLSLYAVWVPSVGVLQNWTCPNNTVMPVGTVTALTDMRDNNTYAVAKLADGKCWMIENLRLDNTNSDNSTGALAQGYGGQFIGLANPETDNFGANDEEYAATAPNSIYYAGTMVPPATVDILQENFAGVRMPRYRNDNTNSDATANPNTTVSNMTSKSQNIYSYGNYYSWAAAKANTTFLETVSGSNAASTSICPKGWRLPQGSDGDDQSTNELWALIVGGINNGIAPANYGSTADAYYTEEETSQVSEKMRTFPNNFVNSGHVADYDTIYNRGARGFYWSATAESDYNAYYLYFSEVYIYPGTMDNSKHGGKTIRCVISPSA